MNLLSIDVGIKNLAYCLFSIKDNKYYTIESWDVVNLCNQDGVDNLVSIGEIYQESPFTLPLNRTLSYDFYKLFIRNPDFPISIKIIYAIISH